ncbi:hypothetical protein KVR01_013610 [Diaporthe batatas]|uniref:uncharacterized protein n=1 Tax=Diaporthe batatas TaxID=748121 RepID=UPI001D041DE1|nr:uncharacterized protein KVR01_013610 [Diaporthe batatas]KAG8156506.1 hypothetical protein KVR01_013610 [Diaporthe batatas]
MVSLKIIRVTVAALCIGQAVVAAPVGDLSVAKHDVNKRWDFLWIIFPQEYEDAVDENGNAKLSDAPFDLDKIDPAKLAESIATAQAAKAAQAGGAAHK